MKTPIFKYRLVIFCTLLLSILYLFSCSNVHRFRPFFFIQISDPQIGFTTVEQDSTSFTRAVQMVNALEPSFIVITGDFVHHTDSVREWEVFDYIYWQISRRVYLVPGNHDIGYKPDMELVAKYREKYGEDYYSFYRQYCLFFVLNSQYFIDDTLPDYEKQMDWLKNVLNPALKNPVHKFVFKHIPLFRHSPDDEDSYEIIPAKHRHTLLKMFTDAGVKYIVTGHNHANHENQYEGIHQIATGSTAIILGDQDYGVGFRVFEVYADRVKHYYVELDDPIQEVNLKR